MMRVATTLAAAGLLWLGASRPAEACGGFFCSLSPMNQLSERILFVDRGDSVTTHVQIQYAGEAADFAWILPVPSRPQLAVSHNELFRQLQFATQPAFFLEWNDQDDSCGEIFPPFYRTLEEADATADGGVQVVAEERVGPYDTVVITADDPEAVIRWLEDNDYVLGDLGPELLAPYVDGGFHFVALRLAPDREVGDLQPIALTYAAERPGIPIILTAIATAPDLAVTAWILGEHRAIPANYLHVQINEALVDWFNGGFNYDDVVTAAADEADGHAFVTDYAGPSQIMEGRLYFEKQWNLGALREIGDPGRYLEALLRQGFPRDPQMQALIRRHIPMPDIVLTEGVLRVVFRDDREAYDAAAESGELRAIAERAYYNDFQAFEEWTQQLPFDADAFTDEIDAVIVTPLRDTQDLFARFDYLTRLYTTLSAEEMTVDPMFDFNPDLPEVSNVRTAAARWECDDLDPEDGDLRDLVLVVTLRDGREVRSRPFADDGLPRPLPEGQLAAAVIERLDTSGPPVPIRRMTAVGETDDAALPADFSLGRVYPNPFNAATLIPFQVPAGDAAARALTLRVYNLLGQPVRTLVEGVLPPGQQVARWDGRADNGRPLASGVYVARLQAGGVLASTKLLYVR
jgi:hypothetical protein